MTNQIIHSKGGRIGEGTDTTAADIDSLVQSLANDRRSHLAIHFHGGLVSKEAATDMAARLSPRYLDHTIPVFYVWESGFLETLQNNLKELASEPVFKQLMRKLLQYALERLGGNIGSRSVVPGAVKKNEVRDAIERHWNEGTPASVPYRHFVPGPDTSKPRSASTNIDIDELRADLETDTAFAEALRTLPQSASSRSALKGNSTAERNTTFSHAMADAFGAQEGGRGVISMIMVAWTVKNILVKVLGRYADQRDHGLYATIVEEILREVQIGGSRVNEWGKALQWNRMKKDTLDAFSAGADEWAGTALLSRLVPILGTDAGPKRITLIGHSTGAIYIANWLAAADNVLPRGIRFDVVLLAPAITYRAFDALLSKSKDRIGNFRMFAMRDEFERIDQVWGSDGDVDGGRDWRSIVYPSSLLYLVSGVLESHTQADGSLVDEPDMPLLGLERHYAQTNAYSGENFPDIGRVRAWLNGAPGRMVWAKTEGQAAGLNCLSIDHGAFDDDVPTLDSISAVLKGWS